MEGTDQTAARARSFAFKRRKRLQPFVAGKKFGGYAGLFEQLLREYPDIEQPSWPF